MLQRKWVYSIPYVLLALIIIIFLATHTPNYIDYDAPSYINFDSIRPPLYPIFIWLFHWAGSCQFTLIVWVHAILTFAALLYTRYWLKKYLKITDFLIFILFIVVVFTISFHFQLLLIGAEGLSFPLFIVSFFLSIDCFKEFNLKKITYLALSVSLLILTRLQFYYFYIIFLILCLWYFRQQIPKKSLSLGVIILLTSVLLTTFIDRTYHYLTHGFFSGAPAVGKLLIVQPIYLTEYSLAKNYFKNEEEKKYAQEMMFKINKQQLNRDAPLLIDTKPSYYELAYQEYNRNYIAIYNIVSQTLADLTPTESSKVASNIAKTITLHESKKNLFFVLWKFIVFIGGVPIFIFFSIIFCALVVKVFRDKPWQPNYSQTFVALSLIILFLNASIVALVETFLVAYFCYSQFIFYCLAILWADEIFLRKSDLSLGKKSGIF